MSYFADFLYYWVIWNKTAKLQNKFIDNGVIQNGLLMVYLTATMTHGLSFIEILGTWVRYDVTKNSCVTVDIYGGCVLNTSHVYKQQNVGWVANMAHNPDPAQVGLGSVDKSS